MIRNSEGCDERFQMSAGVVNIGQIGLYKFIPF